MRAIRSLCAAVIAGAALLPTTAGAAATPGLPRPGSYSGTVSPGGGAATLSVVPGGRTIRAIRIDASAECAGDVLRSGPLRVSPAATFRSRSFHAMLADGEGDGPISGHVTAGGEIEGSWSYHDRGGCGLSGRFAVRRRRGLTASGPRLFDLYGGDDMMLPHGSRITVPPVVGLPATRGGQGPNAAAQLRNGTIAVSDLYADAVEGVSPDGRALLLAGGHGEGDSGDGGPARRATLEDPADVVGLPGGGYLIAVAHCVRRVDPAGTITTFAGVCTPGDSSLGRSDGDGGPATDAHLMLPDGLAVLPDGDVLIADELAGRVRDVSPMGMITTVAGGGTNDPGDGGPATSARIGAEAVAALGDGGFLVAGGDRVCEVAPDGTISTVAGGGRPSLAGGLGDGGPATEAVLDDAAGVAVLPSGGFVVSDQELGAIREVAPDGTISTIAGGGPLGLGAPATDEEVDLPGQLSVLDDGELAIGVLGQDGFTVQTLAPPQTTRLLIAVQPRIIHHTPGRPATVRVRTTVPATLTAEALHGERPLRRYPPRRETAGASTLTVSLPEHATRIRVTARSRGQITSGSVTVR